MKLFSKRFLAVTSSIALLASAFIGCSSDDEDPFNLIEVSGDNATVDATNDGTLVTTDGKTATDATFLRGFKTPKTTEWKQALYKLTINNSSNGGVLGWIFDEENTTPTGATEKVYDFYLLGLKATSSHPSIYLSRFQDVAQSSLSGSGTTFGTEYTMIDSGSENPASGSRWYYQLSDISYDADTGDATVYVVYKQLKDTNNNWTGRYAFGIFADESKAQTWFDGTEYTSSDSLVTTFNAENGTTFTSTYSGSTISDFGVEAAGTSARQRQVGFYAMVPQGGSLKGSYTKIDRSLSDDVVEE